MPPNTQIGWLQSVLEGPASSYDPKFQSQDLAPTHENRWHAEIQPHSKSTEANSSFLTSNTPPTTRQFMIQTNTAANQHSTPNSFSLETLVQA